MYESHPLGLLARIVVEAKKTMGEYPMLTLQSYEVKQEEYGPTNYQNKVRVTVPGQEILNLGPAFTDTVREMGYDVIVESAMSFPNGIVLHIPMIDFATTKKSPQGLLDNMEEATGIDPANLVLFWSGRSFHGYAVGGLTHDKWIKFMGGLLLLNVPGQEEVVDSRWVGHRLQAGSGGLRLTKVSHKYVGMPIAVPNPYEKCPF